MKRQFKTLFAVATFACTAATTLTSDACDRGGRRISFGRSRVGVSYAPSSYRQYSPPVYSQTQPVYSQPQPAYSQSQPVYSQSQPAYSQPQPVYAPSRQLGRQPRQAPAVGTSAPAVGTSAPINNRVVNAPVSGNRPAGRTAPAVSNGRSVSGTAPQGVANSQTGSPSARQPARPVNTPSQTTAGNNAPTETSALQMLASISDTSNDSQEETTTEIPEFGATATSTTGTHVGTWKVTLNGNQSVQLVLNDDKSFDWTATKDGKSSSFEGQYRLEDGRLTLVRSSDLQQMAGSWSGQGTSFTFKLDGATTAGLSFSRG